MPPAGQRPGAGPGLFTEQGGRAIWVSARGSGGFHYRLTDDWDVRHEHMEAKKWAQTEALKPPPFNEKFLHHMTEAKNYEGNDSRLLTYVRNGKLYSQGVWPSPPPEQMKKAHWLCQVNGSTNEYNIITGRKMNPHILKFRREEVSRFRESQSKTQADVGAAGDVQPLPVVACYDIASFVPVYKQKLMGVANRESSLTFMK